MNGPTFQQFTDLPPYPQLWARWTVLAATYAATGDPRGPRILPSLALYQNGRHSVAALYRLPGKRAVLCGEVATSSAEGSAVRPFGFRWEAGRWSVADRFLSPDQCRPALPDIWTTNEAVDTVAALVGDTEQHRAAAVTLVCAAEINSVTPSLISGAFGDHDRFDLTAATGQLAMAGVLTPESAWSAPDSPILSAIPAHHPGASAAELPFAPVDTPSPYGPQLCPDPADRQSILRPIGIRSSSRPKFLLSRGRLSPARA